MLGEIKSLIFIYDRIKKYIPSKFIFNHKSTETVVSRFVKIFESHGVHRNQIPRFFGYGLTAADMKNNEALLPKLSEEMLEAVCTLFAVRREWLDGAESKVHSYHDFYKRPEDFLKFIEKLKAENPDESLEGVLIAPDNTDWRAEAIILIQEPIGCIGDKAIYRYHLCNNWLFPYWKARAYLTACIAIAWKRSVHIHGIYKAKEYIDQLAYGETLLGWNGDDFGLFGHKDWDAEYMTFHPETFLKDIDPEEDDFGFIAGLGLWLELESQGYMESDFTNSREKFEQELAKYQNVDTIS